MSAPRELITSASPSLQYGFRLGRVHIAEEILPLENHRPHSHSHGENHHENVAAPIDEVADRLE
jgi:hypothetical protein